MSIANKLKGKINKLDAGSVFCANDFSALGPRGNIDIILHRLAKDGAIRKLGYGLYDLPKMSDLLGALSPDVNQIIQAYMRRTGHTIVMDPLNAANSLNLTQQVPSQLVFMTNGTSCDLDVCGLHIKLIHAAPKKIAGADTRVGVIIQALQYFGRSGAPRNALKKISRMLQRKDISTLKSLRDKTMKYLAPQIDWIIIHASN